MTRRTVFLTGALAMAVSLIGVRLLGEARQAEKLPTGTGLIVGTVVDAASGTPVSGAVVTIAGGSSRNTQSAFPRILTGPDGRFVYRRLSRGSYGITATKPGYADGAHGRRRPAGQSVPLTLADGEHTADVVVRLWKHAALAGTVLDEAGEPVVGGRVQSWRRGFERGRHAFSSASSAITDDRGVYRLGGLMPGEYIVAVAATEVSRGDAVSVGPSGLLPRTDTSAANAPVLRADQLAVIVRASPVPPPPAGGRLFLYPTIWYPSARLPSQAAIVTVTSGQERSGIDIQLHPVPAVRVSGTVTTEDGPLKSIPLRLNPAGEEIDESGLGTATDGTGAFLFPAVPSGQYSLLVSSTLGIAQNPSLYKFFWADVPLAVGESDVDNVSVAVSGGARIHGRLQFEGATPPPPPNRMGPLPLRVEPADRRMPLPSASLPVDGGQFTSGVYPPGRYFVRVAGSPIGWMFKSATLSGRDVSEEPVEIANEDVHVVLTYTDRWTGLAGTVVSADGRPDPDAIVLVFPADPKSWSHYGASPRRLKSARTRKSGEYSITSLPPGTYNVVAIPDEQAADWMDPVFLEAAARIATQITIADGEQKTSQLRTRKIR